MNSALIVIAIVVFVGVDWFLAECIARRHNVSTLQVISLAMLATVLLFGFLLVTVSGVGLITRWWA